MHRLLPTPSSRRFRRISNLTAGALLTVASFNLSAQSTSPIEHFARQWLDQALANSTELKQGMALRPEVLIGALDSRLQLAPCARIEPYLPTGTQLWGRTRIGLKCVEGPVAWNVYLPITVKAWGPAWVVRRNVPAHTTLTTADAELVPEVDWADNRSPVVPLPEQWLGTQSAFSLVPGQVLRQNAIRPPQVFSAGSQVKVIATGSGFTLTASGTALQQGQVGQVARIKLENGRVVTGTVRSEGTVQINI